MLTKLKKVRPKLLIRYGVVVGLTLVLAFYLSLDVMQLLDLEFLPSSYDEDAGPVIDYTMDSLVIEILRKIITFLVQVMMLLYLWARIWQYSAEKLAPKPLDLKSAGPLKRELVLSIVASIICQIITLLIFLPLERV